MGANHAGERKRQKAKLRKKNDQTKQRKQKAVASPAAN